MDILQLETVGVLGTAFATIALVVLLYKAVRQMESTVSLSKIQTDFRFRAWIGPSAPIKYIDEANGKKRFDIAIKNFGEIPADSVKVFFKLDTKYIEKNQKNSSNVETFDLGPLLPNMEKHYWFFIDSDLFEKVKNQNENIFVLLFFEHKVPLGSSGYGMISEYDSKNEMFVHRDMWIENPESKSL